jgi:hypothetical protein
LTTDQETVGLNPDADLWLDVDEFHDRLAAREPHGYPPTEACPECLRSWRTQFVDSTDALSYPSRFDRLKLMYQ